MPFGYMKIWGLKGEEAGSFKGRDLTIFGYVHNEKVRNHSIMVV